MYRKHNYSFSQKAQELCRILTFGVVLRGLFLIVALTVTVCGQSSQGKDSSNKSGASGSSGSDEASGSGFAIESEMLTYRGLESNSEAVACDIAAYLRKGQANFTNPPQGTACGIDGGGTSKVGVVVFPFEPNAFDDFHMWRADMATMNQLRNRAAEYCPETPKVLERGSESSAPTSVGAFGSAGSALSLVQTVMSMLSSTTLRAAVGGTIGDQAFMDGVGRGLRALRVGVLIPGTFNPYSLGPMNAAHSPFLASLGGLLKARSCLVSMSAQSDTKAAIAQLLTEIDAYLATLSGSDGEKNVNAAPSSATDKSTGKGDSSQKAPPASNTSSRSHLLAVLSADGLAQKLGVDPQTGLLIENSEWQHILLLKALESGGSIVRQSNIWGTKIRYSGGSVGTYALFTLDGELECSGNVYEYGGSIAEKNFQDNLRRYHPDPANQAIFHRGSCRPPADQ